MKPDPQTPASPDEVAALLGWMPIIVRAYGISPGVRSFCASMIARGRRKAFNPSPRQIASMRSIVKAYRERMLGRPADGEGDK